MSDQNHREEPGVVQTTNVDGSRVDVTADSVETIADSSEEAMPPQQTSPFVKPFHFIQFDSEDQQ